MIRDARSASAGAVGFDRTTRKVGLDGLYAAPVRHQGAQGRVWPIEVAQADDRAQVGDYEACCLLGDVLVPVSKVNTSVGGEGLFAAAALPS